MQPMPRTTACLVDDRTHGPRPFTGGNPVSAYETSPAGIPRGMMLGMLRGARHRCWLGLLAGLMACAPVHDPSPGTPPLDRGTAVEVPFRTSKHQRLIDVHIGGRGPFTFLVDTGVGGAAIDSTLAAELGIELDDAGAQSFEQLGETQRIYQIHIPQLAVGTLRLDRLQAAALPLTALGERLGEPLHGILGDGFLKTRTTRFDPVRRTMSFADSLEAFAEDVAAADLDIPLVIDPGSDMPLLDVTLADGRTMRASLDTGSSLGLEIFAPFVDELGLGETTRDWVSGEVLGGSIGRTEILDGTLDEIRIGTLRFGDVPTSITPTRGDSGRMGNLGNQLWEGCVLILAFPEERLVLRRLVPRPAGG